MNFISTTQNYDSNLTLHHNCNCGTICLFLSIKYMFAILAKTKQERLFWYCSKQLTLVVLSDSESWTNMYGEISFGNLVGYNFRM